MDSARVEQSLVRIVGSLNEATWPRSAPGIGNALRRAGVTAIPTTMPGLTGPVYSVPELNGGHVSLTGPGGGGSGERPLGEVEGISILAVLDGGEASGGRLPRLQSRLSSLGFSLIDAADRLVGETLVSGRAVRVDCVVLDGWGGRSDSRGLSVNVTLAA